MGRRIDLHKRLVEAAGSKNVYYNPPEGFKLNYPCIVYKLSKIETRFADNRPYSHERRYSITVIDKSVDSKIVDRLLEFRKCVHDNRFVSENLYHDVFTLYD